MSMKLYLDCAVPVETCNLKCEYCYLTLAAPSGKRKAAGYEYPLETIAHALRPERLGGTALLSLCGAGETLLDPKLPEMVSALLGLGHFVMIVTNGTVDRALERLLASVGGHCERLIFKFSFHFLELRRRHWLERFYANIRRTREAGCSFSLELTPHDSLLLYRPEIKQWCLDRFGAFCHVTIARDDAVNDRPILTALSREQYQEAWSGFDSPLFDYKMKVFGQKRIEYCRAGDKLGYLNLADGLLKQCYRGRVLQNIFKDPQEPIAFQAIGHDCPEPHCYNAHAWLTLGAIAGHQAPAYAQVRDRWEAGGGRWLTPLVYDFLSSRLT